LPDPHSFGKTTGKLCEHAAARQFTGFTTMLTSCLSALALRIVQIFRALRVGFLEFDWLSRLFPFTNEWLPNCTMRQH
jgi:hypothetical protein